MDMQMDEFSDADLLESWRQGHQEAFGALVARHHGLVRAACQRQAAPGDSDDCVQAVFQVLIRRPHAAARAPVLAAWLLHVSWLVCRNSRRRAKRRARVEQAAATMTRTRVDAEPSEALDLLDGCMMRLPPQQRAAITLRYLVGHSPEDTAAILGISRDNAYQLISRGLTGLRGLLARRGIAMSSVAMIGLLSSQAKAACVTASPTLLATLTTKPSAAAIGMATGSITAMKTAAFIPFAAGLILTVGLAATTVVVAQDLPPKPVPKPAAEATKPDESKLKTLLVTSFEDPAACASAEGSSAKAFSTDLQITDGRKAAAMQFDAGNWMTITFPAGKSFSQTDWRGYEAIILDAYNPGNEADMLVLSLRDNANRNWSCTTDVPAKQKVRLAFALNLPKTTMKGYPLFPTIGADVAGYFSPQEFNLANVTSFQFIRWGMKEKSVLFIDNMRLCVVPPVGKFVDRYGQSNLTDWPGKIHADRDLITLHQAEAEALRKAPLPPGRDEWGGAAKGPKLKATGWFRTEKRNGKWWLVTPTGRLFWSVGIDCIGPGVSGPIYDQYMSWLPDDADPLSRFYRKGRSVDFGSMNLYRTFGPDYEKPWLDLTRKRMQTWGFNTIGNWSSTKVYSDLRMPFTFPINSSNAGEFPGEKGNIADFFNDDWRKETEEEVRTVAEKWGKNPNCIGYFPDNEMKWPSPELFASTTLAMSGDRAVKKANTDLLRSLYGNITELNKAWGTEVNSWDDFQAQPVRLPGKRSAALQADQKKLLAAFAERYFTTMAALIKKYAPNQLYLGSRFAGQPAEEVAWAAAKSCDVISYNIYGKESSVQELTKSVSAFDKPVIIGEFHFGALDRGMFSGGVVPVASQEERGIQYAKYIKAALAQPWCVGAHWFQYSDQMLTGRGDGENYNIGFMSVADIPYLELIRHATTTNFDIYKSISTSTAEEAKPGDKIDQAKSP